MLAMAKCYGIQNRWKDPIIDDPAILCGLFFFPQSNFNTYLCISKYKINVAFVLIPHMGHLDQSCPYKGYLYDLTSWNQISMK